jgi:hypothetical protein
VVISSDVKCPGRVETVLFHTNGFKNAWSYKPAPQYSSITNSLTPDSWSTFLPEKLTVPQLVKEFSIL